MRGISNMLGKKALQSAAGVALYVLVALGLVGCQAGTGAADPVRLIVTPVASPTATEPARPTAEPVTYTVKEGDTLSGIADLFGVSVDDIIRMNSISDPNALQVGQVLTIPGREADPEPTGTVEGAGSPTAVGTPNPAATGEPVLPPPDVTPPLGPVVGERTSENGSVPGPDISPTASP